MHAADNVSKERVCIIGKGRVCIIGKERVCIIGKERVCIIGEERVCISASCVDIIWQGCVCGYLDTNKRDQGKMRGGVCGTCVVYVSHMCGVCCGVCCCGASQQRQCGNNIQQGIL